MQQAWWLPESSSSQGAALPLRRSSTVGSDKEVLQFICNLSSPAPPHISPFPKNFDQIQAKALCVFFGQGDFRVTWDLKGY